jgi:hypothetical protein
MEPPQPCLEDEEFQAPKSVWAELKAKLVPAEVPEVVSILGQAQIDRNDELHAEMSTLLDILRDYTAAVDGKARLWRSRFSRDTNRDMLTTEIRSFISALRSKTSTPISLRPSTPHDRSVLGYVLPEQEADALLVTQSARQLLNSRGGSSHGARGGVPANVGAHQRPGTAEVAGRMAREIAAKEGGRDGVGKLSLESMEREAHRFQEVLKQEECELKEHIEVSTVYAHAMHARESCSLSLSRAGGRALTSAPPFLVSRQFLHQVLEAEHERDGLHSLVPTTDDLKDLRDKLQTELSFAAAEDRMSKGKALGGASRLAPLAPLGHSAGCGMGGSPLASTLSGSLPRGATPLCPAPLPSLPPSRDGLDEEGTGHRDGLGACAQSRRDWAVVPTLATAGSASSGGRSAGDGVYQDPASSRPLSRMAAEIGMELDSDEDDFLFGGEDDEMDGARPRSKAAPDVLVLDDDDDSAPFAHPARLPKTEKRDRRSKDSELAGRGAVAAAAAASAGAGGASGPKVKVDAELEAQSQALRTLLSGLVVRDTLADQHRIDEEDDAMMMPAHAAARVADAVLGIGAAPGAGAGATRRVTLGRHRSHIQQARWAQQDSDHFTNDIPTSPGSPTSTASIVASSHARARADIASSSYTITSSTFSATSSSSSSADTRPGPLRAQGHSQALEIAIGTMAPGLRGPMRGIAGGSRTSSPPLPPDAAPGGSREPSLTGRPAMEGVGANGNVLGSSPPMPPTGPRRPPGSAGERLRPMYVRPAATWTPTVVPRS